ncbi:MAG: acyl carrier protein [Candidatus Peribacteraceae bacterium]|nr:acyl carrier protein [Candidatus Peribacteraceae bacterium]MDD5742931.1 acyl carrier protein [Candidatus Peribacteraceae bacterium]
MPTTSSVSIEDIVAESFGVERGEVTDGADLVRDLGAQRVDFLQLQYSIRQRLGVGLSLDEIAVTLLNGATAATWRDALWQGFLPGLSDDVRSMAPDAPVPVEGMLSTGEPFSVGRLCALVNAHLAEVAQPV